MMQMLTVPILAKRQIDATNKPAYEETLAGHSQLTVEAFRTMFGTEGNPSRLCQEWLRFFKIKDASDEFLRTMPAICLLHDIGKANSGFQDAIKNRGSQVIRHEHLSGLLLMLPEIQQLLEQCRLDVYLVVTAIIGHHLKADHDGFGEPMSPDAKVFRVYSSEAGDLLAIMGQRLGVQTPRVTIPDVWSFGGGPGCFDLTNSISKVKQDLHQFRRKLDGNTAEHHLLMAMRAALIVADSAASGLVREGHNIQEWISAAFSSDDILDGKAIETKVIEPRVTEVTRQRGDFQWKPFQSASEQLPERALMLASCGSGKTLAAWRWIKARTAKRPVARVIFLYPTRGTATEGFRDYVSWAPEADAALVHGTSAFELDGMFEDARSGKDFTTEDRLFALGYWQRRVFSATVDQFLGFMQHVYRSTCLMPLLADSVVVIDEVHSFDKSLFSSLKRFLKDFDVPVLCMTASLTKARRCDLKDCGLTIFPESPDQFPDLQLEAEMSRYQIRRLENEEGAREIALNALKKGRRVLWVVNTVPRCQRLARELTVMCYHSRFRLEDRKRHHNKVVAAFQPEKDAILAVTTQVCEMSLDLDADVLITETAPITSLIQRMGRCNRHARPGQNKLGEVYFYTPENEKPYAKDELSGTTGFVKEVTGKETSQAELEDLLEKYGPAEVEVERYAAFLESGPWAMAREEQLRNEHEFTVQAILDADIGRYLQMRLEHQPIDGLIVPIPRYFQAITDSRVKNLRVAPATHYSPDYGFLDQEITP